ARVRVAYAAHADRIESTTVDISALARGGIAVRSRICARGRVLGCVAGARARVALAGGFELAEVVDPNAPAQRECERDRDRARRMRCGTLRQLGVSRWACPKIHDAGAGYV